jgi:hypothetical protein
MIRRMVWLVLWVIVFAGMWIGGQRADQVFEKYVEAGNPKTETIYELIPSNTQVFAQSRDFSKEWRVFRKSETYRSFSSLPPVRDVLKTWKMNEAELSLLEKWILQNWGPSLVIAASRQTETIYFYSPVGPRQQCLRWLLRMQQAFFSDNIRWDAAFRDGHWHVDVELPFLPAGWKAQFFPVRGIAVLAIGRKADPLAEVLRLADGGRDSLFQDPAFNGFLARGSRVPNATFGFVRSGDEKSSTTGFGVQWLIAHEADGRLFVDVSFPVNNTGASTALYQDLQKLAMLRQDDDQIAMVASWEDLGAIGEECSRFLPKPFRESFLSGGSRLPEPFSRQNWEPVLNKLGHSVFIGLGKSELISDKFNVPFPRTVVAFPYTEQNQFLRVMENLVLKSNSQQYANLLIRKVAQPCGTYYELRMGSSPWRDTHGLKELPVFAFSNGMLILALNCETMEKALQTLNARIEKPAPEKIEGVNVWANLRTLPESLRLLLAASVLIQSRNENVFVTPSAMQTLNDIVSILQQFGETSINLTYENGRGHILARVAP